MMSMPVSGHGEDVAADAGQGQPPAPVRGPGQTGPLSTPARGGADPDDPLSAVEHWGSLTPMIGFLVVTGALLSVAAATGAGWLFVVGLILVLVWIAGFATRRGSWMRW